MHPHRQFNAFPLTDTGTQAHAQAHTGATGYRVPKGFLTQQATASPRGSFTFKIPRRPPQLRCDAPSLIIPTGFLPQQDSATPNGVFAPLSSRDFVTTYEGSCGRRSMEVKASDQCSVPPSLHVDLKVSPPCPFLLSSLANTLLDVAHRSYRIPDATRFRDTQRSVCTPFQS